MALTSAEIQQVLDAIAALGKKISGLPDSDTLVGNELVELSQGGNSVKSTLDNILSLVGIPTGIADVNNLVGASAAPTVTDDSASDYAKGSLWFYSGILYICQDATVGAAVWIPYSESFSGQYTPTVSDIANGGTVTLDSVRYYKVGGMVNFIANLRVDLDAAVTSDGFHFTLDSLIQPSANFANLTDVIGIVVINTQFSVNVGGSLFAVVGTKKVVVSVNTDSAGATVKATISGTYFI